MKFATLTTLALLAAFGVSGFAEESERAPLPEKLVTAKTVFIQNESGETGFADAVFAHLQEWGRWKVVTN